MRTLEFYCYPALALRPVLASGFQVLVGQPLGQTPGAWVPVPGEAESTLPVL
ncbi:MAG: hypothetical protein WCI95_12440 [bacterium]